MPALWVAAGECVGAVCATLCGVHLLPLVLGLVASQSLAGRWAAHADRLRAILVTGLLLNTAGLLLLATLSATTDTLALSGYFFVTGVGMGMIPMVVLTAVQNTVPFTGRLHHLTLPAAFAPRPARNRPGTARRPAAGRARRL